MDINTFPTVQFSYERQLHKSFSLQGEVGCQLYSFYKSDTSFIHPGGFKANLELRYYLPDKLLKERAGNLTGFYIAANIFYRQSKDNRVLFYYPSNDTTLLTDYFYGIKKIWGLNLIVGYQFNTSEKFVFDIYGGVGTMIRISTEHNLEYNEKSDTQSSTSDFTIQNVLNESYLRKNNGRNVSLTLGVRVGIRL